MSTAAKAAETLSVPAGDQRAENAEPKHSPLPWSFDGDWNRIPTIFAADGRTMVATVEKGTCSHDARPSPERKANAELIVRAVNSHADMLAALKAIADYYDEDDILRGDLEQIRAAISKATGAAS